MPSPTIIHHDQPPHFTPFHGLLKLTSPHTIHPNIIQSSLTLGSPCDVIKKITVLNLRHPGVPYNNIPVQLFITAHYIATVR